MELLILSLTITFGLILGKLKVANVSLGLAWVLFVGIAFSYFPVSIDEHLLHFLKDFGLILFVYSIGLQVGPGFFSSFGKGGLQLNMLAIGTILMSIVVTLTVFCITDIPMTTLTGILSGAVTNTPGLGAAQQAAADLHGADAPEIATAYAAAYPVGVVGAIVCFLVLRFLLRINCMREEVKARQGQDDTGELSVKPFTVRITNQMIVGKSVIELCNIMGRDFVISRLLRNDEEQHTDMVNGQTSFSLGDQILITAAPKDIEAITAFLGEPSEVDWEKCDHGQVSRRILISKPEINGKTIGQLHIRTQFGANITHVYRSGVELVAAPHLRLQMGDRVTIVGTELAISHTEKWLGNEMKRLNVPNLIPIFLGIALGCLLADVPLRLPGMSHPLKLGLTGGPLIVAILIGYFGPKYKLITYNTVSSNLMIRQLGICIFLACVGLGVGRDFVSTVFTAEGLRWVGIGALITIIPLLVCGIVGRMLLHLNYYTLIGVLAGAHTNPPALTYASQLTSSDLPAVAYATVYPFAMFLRIITIQILILTLG
jgi:putative transport protein